MELLEQIFGQVVVPEAVYDEALKATKTFHPDKEASTARILAEAMRNQRL